MSTDTDTAAAIRGWFSGRLPQEWTSGGAPDVVIDREEITVVLTIPEPELADDAGDAERSAARAGRIKAFREDTRERRIELAREVEHRFDRKVAWGVHAGEREELFTHLAVPVMTRLRQPDRQVLDTLVEAGVARSRAHALAWCVRLTGEHAEEWLGQLRTAMKQVQEVRDAGPGLG
jgi:hypothetical protein